VVLFTDALYSFLLLAAVYRLRGRDSDRSKRDVFHFDRAEKRSEDEPA
jgi:hypothetical protein